MPSGHLQLHGLWELFFLATPAAAYSFLLSCVSLLGVISRSLFLFLPYLGHVNIYEFYFLNLTTICLLGHWMSLKL